MKFRKKVNKALALLLALSLVMSTNLPVGVLANEADEVPEAETVGNDPEFVMSAEDVIGIDLKANSAIIQEAVGVSGNTIPNAFNLIVDSDMDGEADADEEKLAIDGVTEFDSGLNIYGTYNASTDERISITQNSGTVGTIYGSYCGNVTSEGDSISIIVNGGTASAICGLDGYDYYVSGRIVIVIGDNATVGSCTIEDSEGYPGYYYNNQGAVEINGNYTMQENETYASLNIAGGTFVVPEGLTLTADEISLSSTYGIPYLVLRGCLDVTDLTPAGSGRILVDGGTLPENFSYVYTYYPLMLKSDISNTAFVPSSTSYYTDYTEDDVTTRFLQANKNIGFKNVLVEGYDCYYSVEGSDYTAVTTSTFNVPTPQSGSLEMELMYVPTQISVSNTYSAPKGYVGTTYTAENPLCDLSVYPITGDATEEYGGEVKYAVKKTTPLPEGLSLSKGKIVGTPAEACADGQKVTIVVTGRNGSTTNLELTIKIAEGEGTSKNINELVTVDEGNGVIDLNGTSVVIMPSEKNPNSRAKMFLDLDADKLPDNNIALQINNTDELSFTSYRIYGYRDTQKPYDGDIHITVKGGQFAYLRGVAGTSAEEMATVNGDVVLAVDNIVLNTTTGSMAGAEYGKAENVTVEIRDGSFRYTDIYGAINSEISGDVTYVFADEVYSTAGSADNPMLLYAAADSEIGGDIHVEIGYIEKSSNYGFQSASGKTHVKYHGVSNASVAGNINYLMEGYWYPDENYLVENSNVQGDVSVEWDNVSVCKTYAVTGTEITGSLALTAQKDKMAECANNLYLLTGASSAESVKMDVPASCTGTFKLGTGVDSDCTVNNATYMNNKGNLVIGGDYTIEENVDLTGLTILSAAEVQIAKDATVNLTGGTFNIKKGAKLTNYGILNYSNTAYGGTVGLAGVFENKGEFHQLSMSTDGYWFAIEATGSMINHETGVWTVASRIYNNGTIVNYGSFVQTYLGKSCTKLGTVYTTKVLNLSKAAVEYTTIEGLTSYSNLYFAMNTDYPTQCIQEVTLQGDALTTSGVAGDTNQYIKVDRYTDSVPFTVTLGEQIGDKVILDSVTYGPEHTNATKADENDATVWNGNAAYIYEPITVTLNYSPTGEVTPITLSLQSDSISDLTVDDAYTYEEPLYDLTKLTIENDMEAEDGKVLYMLKEGSLPEGIAFKDGKLYGTFRQATTEETTLVFTVKGVNLTTADFTLTLGPVAKAIPDWEVPTGFETIIGKQVEDVALPVDARGTYTWESSTQAVGDNVGTIMTNLIFKPADTDNYDWEKAATNAGINAMWDGSNSSICCTISITVNPGIPQVTAPAGLTAIYGQSFADVEIPADENGIFVWDEEHHAQTDLVGDVGEHICYVTYQPMSENYAEKTGIEVTLTVSQATPEYNEALKEMSIICDETLGDTVLPDVDGGKYQWVSATTIAPTEGVYYSVIYLPEDTVNYDWSTIEGWHKYRKGVVFSVKVTLDHAWDEGVITTPATTTQTGVRTYTCGLCDATRTETIAKLPGDISGGGATGGNGNVGNATQGAPLTQPQVGYTLSDKSSKAVYKVSKVDAEVTYVKPSKKTYTKVKIPNTIKYQGVTYKVTAIANNAFKNNEKLKSVTIGTNIRTIGNSAFQNCTALKSVTIPKNVSKIGSKAFYGCKKLMKMTIKTTKLTEKKVGKNAFKNMGKSNFKKVTVKVPKKKLKAYKKMLVKRGLSKKAKVKK